MFQSDQVGIIPPMVSEWTAGWGVISEGSAATAPASAVWPTANTGYYFPIYVPTICVARRMWWVNGATVDAGYNVEAGIYRDGGYKPSAKLITTGSVAQGTLNQLQWGEITDTTLTPGLWWLFMSCSTTSATFFRCAPVASWDELLHFQQGSVGPGSAPATATPVEGSGQYLSLFGFSTTTIT